MKSLYNNHKGGTMNCRLTLGKVQIWVEVLLVIRTFSQRKVT